MPTKQFVCGENAESPVNGQTIFNADFLGNCQVNFLLVNNIPENQLEPSADFTHSYVQKQIKRTNAWITGDKLIIDYTPCKDC